MMEQPTGNYKEFSLVRGGLLYKLLVYMRLMRPDLEPLYYRAIFFGLLTWLPLLILSAMQGMALGGSIKVPFLYDLTELVRFLLAVPLLIMAERVVDNRSNEVIRHFIDSDLIEDKDIPQYEAIVRQIMRMVKAIPVEGVIVVLVILYTLFLRMEFSEVSSTWQFLVTPSGQERTPAGWWYLTVSIPIFQFLMARWLYRYLLWCWFLWRVSRLELRLISTHPDRVGGLAFLGVLQVKFCPIIFALASVVSAYIGREILFGGASLQHYQMMIPGDIILLVIIFLGPYLVFSVQLFRAKVRGFLAYSALANDYTFSFHRKWIGKENPNGEQLLGTSDIQSLADISNSFAIVRDMRIVPFDLRTTIIPFAACAVIPFLPLLLLVFPLEEIVMKSIQILL
jgi:hypothetical protein